MRDFIFLTLLSLVAHSLLAQENVEYISRLGYEVRSSDIWGYESPEGRNYAIVGLFNGTSIVDVTEPTSPVEVIFIERAESIWRDMKVWNNHAYVVNETSGGMLIIDLEDLPAFPDTVSYRENELESAHNIFIDENGFAYLVGANILGGGAVFLDLSIDPKEPIFAGAYEEQYIHDVYVRGDTMWGGEIYVGKITAVDVSDKANPVVLGSQETPSAFTHNGWLSGDGKTVFTTDEVSGGYVTAYDVSDISDIKELDRYRSSPGSGVIPHNTFWMDSFLITSYYRDGITIVDAHRPTNLIEVGSYDTSPFPSDNGFNGCWGVYPYFSNGLIIASDIEEGLFVLEPTYVRAAYLEGNILEELSGLPVGGATVDVLSTENTVFTDISGAYATGASATGLYDVRVSKPGCITQFLSSVELESGLITTLNINLTCTATVNITSNDIDEMFSIYPMPFSESTHIQLNTPTNDIAIVHLLDPSGRIIEQYQINPNTSSLSIGGDLASGVYFVRLILNGTIAEVKKVIKL